jgi:hypothetical protein
MSYRIATLLISLNLGAAMPTDVHAQTTPAPEFALTIYSSAEPGGVAPEQLNDASTIPGYALVSDTRDIELTAGRAELRFSDVAQQMDPTTVAFTSLTDPAGTRVLEQNYQFDLVSQQKLLQRYIGEQIRVTQAIGNERVNHSGTLLGATDGILLQTSDGVLALNSYQNVAFASVPGGLITKPTLVWLLDTQKGGTHKARVAYQTRGMTWWSDYNIVLASDEANPTLQLSAWVSLVNQSGASFPQSKIKLVAGTVNRAPVTQPQVAYMKSEVRSMSVQEDSFQESSLFEYHLYTLGRRSDLPDNSTKQLELFPTKVGIPAKRELIFTAENVNRTMFYGGANVDQGLANQSKGKVSAYLSFDNKAAIGLGMPMPKGRIRVSQAGPDGALEFIGEDLVEHTPKNERIQVKLGDAFDVVGDRKQTDFQLDSTGKTLSESFEISVRNRKATAVKVNVREYLYRWSGWEITQASVKHVKQDAQTIDFPVEIAADSEQKISYTVRYKW